MSWRRGCRPLMLQELIVKSDFGAMMELITKFDKKMTGLDTGTSSERSSI